MVDSGPLYAYADADDAHHAECRELLEAHPGPLLVPSLAVTEVAYLLATRLGWQPEVLFLGDLAAGNFTLEPVRAPDLLRMAELVGRYHDLPLGSVDASVIAAAERLGITDIATLDHRHFGIVRPKYAKTLNLLP
ncbi:MAG TPA: PIN domain-containing protein [Solirubrobacteraceae bacterium]|nr:PIN domain-containing protein [Solirubrobacteraceae bacterium]